MPPHGQVTTAIFLFIILRAYLENLSSYIPVVIYFHNSGRANLVYLLVCSSWLTLWVGLFGKYGAKVSFLLL